MILFFRNCTLLCRYVASQLRRILQIRNLNILRSGPYLFHNGSQKRCATTTTTSLKQKTTTNGAVIKQETRRDIHARQRDSSRMKERERYSGAPHPIPSPAAVNAHTLRVGLRRRPPRQLIGSRCSAAQFGAWRVICDHGD